MEFTVILSDYISFQNRHSCTFADRAYSSGISGFFCDVYSAAVYNIGGVSRLYLGCKRNSTKQHKCAKHCRYNFLQHNNSPFICVDLSVFTYYIIVIIYHICIICKGIGKFMPKSRKKCHKYNYVVFIRSVPAFKGKGDITAGLSANRN